MRRAFLVARIVGIPYASAMHIREIIKAAGGPVALARQLGIRHSSVCEWDEVPAKRVPAVSAATGLARHVIRPDIYEAPDGK